ncbi:MAG: FAD-binding oxidoreductase [Rhodospirillaceae bacterium]|nr:FAD-binding oxidoreductase [Rhodospirillaceae bacterium]
MSIPTAATAAIKEVVGPNGWLDTPEDVEPFVVETRGLWRGECDLVVSPASTDELARVVKICADAGIPITPQSGNTGLVGGAIPHGGVIINTRRMNKIRDVDALNNTMTVEAGCILADIQNAADDVDRLFPLSLAAEGSCCIGGNLSTNAGGIQVLRYGNARDLVLGLEVVTADGKVWNGLQRLRKNNTGYDLKHLFMGAEGTLGIITAAVLKLFPKPRRRETAFIGAASVEAVQALFSRMQDAMGDSLSAFEYANEFSIGLVFEHIDGANNPLQGTYPAYALMEVSSLRDDETTRDQLETVLADALEDEVIIDAVVAQSEAQSKALWNLRESMPEAQKHARASIKHDVSVPVSKVAEFVRNASKMVIDDLPGIRPSAFGHFGDGNIHFNLTQPADMEPEDFLAKWNHFNEIVHDYVATMNGSFSAEHGVGELKRKDVARYNDPVGVDIMRAMKASLDPNNIMNPGKVLPDAEPS